MREGTKTTTHMMITTFERLADLLPASSDCLNFLNLLSLNNIHLSGTGVSSISSSDMDGLLRMPCPVPERPT